MCDYPDVLLAVPVEGEAAVLVISYKCRAAPGEEGLPREAVCRQSVPVVHVKTVSASWDDPSTAPNGEALDGFKGIGTTSMSFRGVATVKA